MKPVTIHAARLPHPTMGSRIALFVAVIFDMSLLLIGVNEGNWTPFVGATVMAAVWLTVIHRFTRRRDS